VMGRFATGLVFAVLLLPILAHATTAPSLSGRIKIDGILDEYAADEWVLDATSTPPESDRDSSWELNNDISRVAITWDQTFLYIAIEAKTFDAFLATFVSNRSGGLRTLEDAGAFRRAIELPQFPLNLIALARPERLPEIVRADDAHPLALVDRSALPAAVSRTDAGVTGFEMAVPWSMLSLGSPVRVISAITGEVGTGTGDATPDPTTRLDDERFARAVLDRWFSIDADVNNDGIADDGISPRAAGGVEPDAVSQDIRSDVSVRLDVLKRAFAPDRGEQQEVVFEVEGGAVYVNFYVYSLEGQRVRFLNEALPDLWMGVSSAVPVPWGGRDEHGDIVRGGTYIIVADWGYNRGEHSGRAKSAVVVVR
jgi:hypothetical protein